jgi:hypothetical protein
MEKKTQQNKKTIKKKYLRIIFLKTRIVLFNDNKILNLIFGTVIFWHITWTIRHSV